MAWPFKKAVEQPQVNERDYSIADPAFAAFLGLTSYTGETVNEVRALNISAVYRAVSLIAGSIATLPLRTVKTNSKNQKQRVDSWLDTPYGPPEDDKLYKGSQDQWKRTIAFHYAMYNEVFLFKLRNKQGQILGAVPIHPLNVTVKVDKSVKGQRVYSVCVDGKTSEDYLAEDMHHIVGLSLDGVRGAHVLALARNSFGIALAGEKTAGTVMKNGGVHNVLVTPTAEAGSLKRDEAKTMVTDLHNEMSGPDNAGKFIMINRALKLDPFSMTMEDAQFLESRVFQIEEIARWFGIPPHLLGLTEKSTSWGTGIAEQNAGLQRYTLNPITTAIEESLSLLFENIKVEFDYAGFLAPTPKDEIELIIAEMNGGLITPNEARALRNLPPVEGGDTLRTPAGQTPPTEGGNMNAPQDSQTTQ